MRFDLAHHGRVALSGRKNDSRLDKFVLAERVALERRALLRRASERRMRASIERYHFRHIDEHDTHHYGLRSSRVERRLQVLRILIRAHHANLEVHSGVRSRLDLKDIGTHREEALEHRHVRFSQPVNDCVCARASVRRESVQMVMPQTSFSARKANNLPAVKKARDGGCRTVLSGYHARAL